MQGYCAAAQGNVLRLKLAEVDARDDLTMDNQKKTVANEEFWNIGILILAGDELVHRELHSLETLQLLNLANHSGLIDLNDGALGVRPQEMEQPCAGDAPDDKADGECGQEDASNETLSP
jgi:hypothetical protein